MVLAINRNSDDGRLLSFFRAQLKVGYSLGLPRNNLFHLFVRIFIVLIWNSEAFTSFQTMAQSLKLQGLTHLLHQSMKFQMMKPSDLRVFHFLDCSRVTLDDYDSCFKLFQLTNSSFFSSLQPLMEFQPVSTLLMSAWYHYVL